MCQLYPLTMFLSIHNTRSSLYIWSFCRWFQQTKLRKMKWKNLHIFRWIQKILQCVVAVRNFHFVYIWSEFPFSFCDCELAMCWIILANTANLWELSGERGNSIDHIVTIAHVMETSAHANAICSLMYLRSVQSTALLDFVDTKRYVSSIKVNNLTYSAWRATKLDPRTTHFSPGAFQVLPSTAFPCM